MKYPIALAIFALALLAPQLVGAHGLTSVEDGINESDRYAQFVEKNAPDFRLYDVDGNPSALKDFAGKVVVLHFTYLRCTDDCPLHMNLLGRLQSMVRAAGMSDQVQFITIATDTEEVAATRELMRGYGKNFGLTDDNWSLLFRGEEDSPDATVKVAEGYGLKFVPVDGNMQMHGVVTHVVDQTGVMRARFHGLKFEPVNLVSYVNALVNDDHSQH